MKIYKTVNQLNTELTSDKGVVIGNFDGVHLGHRHLLESFLSSCKNFDATPILIILNPHPQIYFQGENCASMLSTHKDKLLELKKIGIENILEIDFTSEIQSMEASEFIRNFLLKIDRLKHVTLGHDFALGSGKEDSKDFLLKEAPKTLNIDQVRSFTQDGEVCSSTKVREYLGDGQVLRAHNLLGRAYQLSGTVINGLGNGENYLVPTANIEIDSTLLIPKSGVYFTKTKVGKEIFSSITNIGNNPTIKDGLTRTIETHLLDYTKNIYGKLIEVSFYEKCRDEIKFENIESLKTEILKNIEQRRTFKC